jgi:hypothetical protein
MIIAFDNQVSLGQSLSANGVAYLTGPVGSVLAFETTPRTLTTQLATISSSAIPFTARIDRAYQGIQFGVVLANRSSTIFTAATGTATQTVSANGFDSVTPDVRRLVNLGYL